MISSRFIVRYVEIAFLMLVVALAIYVPVVASRWQIQARLFPMVVAFPLLALALAQLSVAIRARNSSPVGQGAIELEELGLWHPVARKGTLRLAAWIGAFLVCVTLFSFPLGLSLGICLYLRFESRERWLLCLLLAGVTFAYIYVVFSVGLHLPWPDGIVTQYLQQ